MNINNIKIDILRNIPPKPPSASAAIGKLWRLQTPCSFEASSGATGEVWVLGCVESW